MEKVVKTPTVTFRYPLATKIQIDDSSTPIAKLGQTLKDVNEFFTKEALLKSDHTLLQRLIYKFNSQLRHFKSFKNLKRINQYMVKFMTLSPDYEEECTNLKECCSQEQGSLFLPSRQMLEYLLAKSMQLSFVLRKVVLFCMNTFQACLSSIHRAELTGAHLIFCSLSSRIWIISRTVILKLVEWYNHLVKWLPNLKGTEADCLNGFVLADELRLWLDTKCPVNDDPSLVETKPAEADNVLARFMAGEDVLGTGDTDEKGHDSAESQGDSTESETEVTMAVTRSRKRARQTEMQAEISRPGTPREDLGVSIKRKAHSTDLARDSPGILSPKRASDKPDEGTSKEDIGIIVKRKAFLLGEEGRRSSGRNSPRRGPRAEESTSRDLGIVAKRIAHLQEEGRASSGRNSPRRGTDKSGEGTSRDLGMVARRIADLSEECKSPGRNSPKRGADRTDEDSASTSKRKKNGENGNVEPKPGTSKKKKIKNGASEEATNGASESNGTPAVPEPKAGSSNGNSNGVFAVPKRRRRSVTRKAQPGLSKIDYKKTMKTKLKKPARFLEELSHSSMEIGKELVVLPRTSRLKLVQELTVILKEFNSKKKEVAKQPEGQKSRTLKQVKKLRLAFKRHARDALWKLMQK